MKNLLEKIIQSNELFARLLNTLSLLEYIGCRKILKSQHQETITPTLLAHAAEELRHARILKKFAIKLAPGLCTTYQSDALLCGREANTYFQTIDHASSAQLKEDNAWVSYLYTTYLIETRALTFYETLEITLNECTGKSLFKGILLEENKHLFEIEKSINQNPANLEHLTILKSIEETEFQHFIQSIKHYINK